MQTNSNPDSCHLPPCPYVRFGDFKQAAGDFKEAVREIKKAAKDCRITLAALGKEMKSRTNVLVTTSPFTKKSIMQDSQFTWSVCLLHPAICMCMDADMHCLSLGAL